MPAAVRQFADVFTSLLGFEILMAGVPASTVVAVSACIASQFLGYLKMLYNLQCLFGIKLDYVIRVSVVKDGGRNLTFMGPCIVIIF